MIKKYQRGLHRPPLQQQKLKTNFGKRIKETVVLAVVAAQELRFVVVESHTVAIVVEAKLGAVDAVDVVAAVASEISGNPQE